MGRDRLDDLIARYDLDEEVAVALRAWYAVEAPPPEPGSIDSDGPALPERYVYDSLIGMGGMGEVHRVLDGVLGRTVAMKILRAGLAERRGVDKRFHAEARATAQLEHPGIVPVYDYGSLPDGRSYFTMREIKGDTLSAVAFPVHTRTHRDRRWGRSKAGWTLTRLLDVFRRACQAVAHAHAHDVLHRDLKPENLMVGDLGEVLVVDWGLAKVRREGETPVGSTTTKGGPRSSLQTRAGTVAGTPAYMAPEQAFGRIAQLGPHSDVYALGSILYFLLAGRPPYEGDAMTVLDAVRTGAPAPLVPLAPVSSELLDICTTAMARDPHDRFEHAGALAEALLVWEDGAARRKKALELVGAAQDELPRLWRLREQARLAETQAQNLAEKVRSWQPLDDKAELWAVEDEADRLTTDAELAEHRAAQLLRGALTHEPEMPEAHAVLADLYRQRHEEAERTRNASAARRYALLLAEHDRTGLHDAYLAGDGALTLHTSVPADVTCFRLVERGRRLVPELVGELGQTPLEHVPLERGSYLLELEAPGCEKVRYPVFIQRQTHWDGVPPGGDAPHPILLPRLGSLRGDEVYVPAGWYWAGAYSEKALSIPLERTWCTGFAIGRDPITNHEYLAFLNGLVDAGRAREAKRWVPRHRGESGASIYGRDSSGHFCLVPDSDGDTWGPRWPVLLVSWEAAQAYASWRAEQDGVAWRLPWQTEWEKAARGVDQRIAPWGNYIEPTWAAVRDGREGRPLPSDVDAHPIDESVYGMRGAAGNVADWCLDAPQPGMRTYRGGAWSYPSAFGNVTYRRAMRQETRSETTGVRMARTLPEATD